MDISEILFYLIVGAIVGLLGKFFAPGNKDNIPLWLTIICGIGGMLLGDVIYRAFGGNGSRGGEAGLDPGLRHDRHGRRAGHDRLTVTGRSRSKVL